MAYRLPGESPKLIDIDCLFIINANRGRCPATGPEEEYRWKRRGPRSWSAAFSGRRALFIHNAHGDVSGFAGEIPTEQLHGDITANLYAPLVLADAFVRACGTGYESGLVMLSSAAARVLMEGLALYCAAKAAVEMWVRTVRRERETRGAGPWIVAVRPGFVDTPSARAAATKDPRQYPAAPALEKAFEAGAFIDPEDCARDIWAALPGDQSVLLFGEVPAGATGRPRDEGDPTGGTSR